MKTELVNNDQKLEILVEGERYRVCNICTFIGVNEENTMLIKHNPLSYGLAVEQKNDKWVPHFFRLHHRRHLADTADYL